MTTEEQILRLLEQQNQTGSLVYKPIESLETYFFTETRNVIDSNEFYSQHYTQSALGYENSVVNLYSDPNCDVDAKIMTLYFGSNSGYGAQSNLGKSRASSDTNAIYSKINYMFDYNLKYENIYAIEFHPNYKYDQLLNAFFQINLTGYDISGNLNTNINSFILSGSSIYTEMTKYTISPVISGSLASDFTLDTEFGLINPDQNIIVFDADKLDSFLNFNTNYTTNLNAKNVNILYNSFSQSMVLSLNDNISPIVSNGSVEKKYSSVLLEINTLEFNYTNNPTFFDKNTNKFRSSYTLAMQNVYFTTIGLYNEKYELLAVAKLSRPLPKNFTEKYAFEIILNIE